MQATALLDLSWHYCAKTALDLQRHHAACLYATAYCWSMNVLVCMAQGLSFQGRDTCQADMDVPGSQDVSQEVFLIACYCHERCRV